MEPWLQSALGYLRGWIEFQLRTSQRPGCIVAIAHRGKVVAEYRVRPCQSRHRRKADPAPPLPDRFAFQEFHRGRNHEAAGAAQLRLDDPVGQYVKGLHPHVAETTIAQLLSHSAGLTRDGADSGQFVDRRPYLNAKELMAELQLPPAIAPNSRFKYSNHGFGLLGLAIEAITGEPYRIWIEREIVDAAGLRETTADMPLAKSVPFARGHTSRFPLERRLVIPGDNPAHAMASAAGFVSTAADVARYFAQLAPNAKRSVLSAGSRREMTRKHWRNLHGPVEGYYGLGIISGNVAGWDWFGHSGGFQGYISRTAVIPACDLTVSILTNSIDGWAELWIDGAINILRVFKDRGAPKRRIRDWTGRWWTTWSALDLVPVGDRVVVANPLAINPFMAATEIEITGRDTGRVVAGDRVMQAMARPFAGSATRPASSPMSGLAARDLKREKSLTAEMERRYGRRKRR